jgi:hypothetical protein
MNRFSYTISDCQKSFLLYNIWLSWIVSLIQYLTVTNRFSYTISDCHESFLLYNIWLSRIVSLIQCLTVTNHFSYTISDCHESFLLYNIWLSQSTVLSRSVETFKAAVSSIKYYFMKAVNSFDIFSCHLQPLT